MNRRRFPLRRLALAALALPLVAAAVFVAWPLPGGLLGYRPVSSLRILDRQGNLLRELLSRDDGRSVPLASSELPPVLRQAFIAAEDHTFLSHPGLSLRAIARAVRDNLRAHRRVAGGSTLTQQLARALVPRPRTLPGKLREALWALRLEAHLSKEEILTQYLNRVSFGSNTFGVEAAAQLYFGRSARNVSLAQAAALAALPRGPVAYHPLRHPERLRERQAWVLGRMAALGSVPADEAERARAEPLDLSAFSAAFRAPHFVNFIVKHLEAWGLQDATQLRTSLDPRLQAVLEDAIAQNLHALSGRQAHQGAGVVLDNATGEVLAYVGSADFFDDDHAGQYDGVQEPRQPGSTLKPFLYGEGFVSGMTPATVLADTPTAFQGARGDYRPRDYDLRSRGPVRAREALASSLNVPAVRVAERLGPERFLQALHRAGFDSLRESAAHYGLGLALGNGEVTLWELARGYRGLAREGRLAPLTPVLEARAADGRLLRAGLEHRAGRFLPAPVAALVTDILSDASARAPAFGLENVLRLPFPIAAKTGTSKGFADNWTAGYTRERTVAVWVGNFDRRSMVETSGITGAAPVFRRAMLAAMEQRTPAPLSGVRLSSVFICSLSGERVGPSCPDRMEERFVPGTEPQASCAMHRAFSANVPPEADCRALAQGQPFVTDVGPQFYAWSSHRGDDRWRAAACGQGAAATPIALMEPRGGDSFFLLDDLPLADQAIPVHLRAGASEGVLELRVDGQPAGQLRAPFQGHLPATPGNHLLTVHRPGDPAALAQAHFQVSRRRSQGRATVRSPP